MSLADTHNPLPALPDPVAPVVAVVKQLKKLPLREQIAILIAAISAGLMAGILFIVCAVGFIITLGESFGLPLWLVLTFAVPAALAGIFLGGKMALSTYRYEHSATRGEADKHASSENSSASDEDRRQNVNASE